MSGYFEEMGWTPLENGQQPNHLIEMARFLADSGMWDLLGQREKLPPPASKNVVENLPEIEITTTTTTSTSTSTSSSDDESPSKQCPVCLKEFENGGKAKSLPCRHFFHRECILPWLQQTNSCPLCRYELPTDDQEYEMYRKEKTRAAEREKDMEALHNSMFT